MERQIQARERAPGPKFNVKFLVEKFVTSVLSNRIGPLLFPNNSEYFIGETKPISIQLYLIFNVALSHRVPGEPKIRLVAIVIEPIDSNCKTMETGKSRQSEA